MSSVSSWTVIVQFQEPNFLWKSRRRWVTCGRTKGLLSMSNLMIAKLLSMKLKVRSWKAGRDWRGKSGVRALLAVWMISHLKRSTVVLSENSIDSTPYPRVDSMHKTPNPSRNTMPLIVIFLWSIATTFNSYDYQWLWYQTTLLFGKSRCECEHNSELWHWSTSAFLLRRRTYQASVRSTTHLRSHPAGWQKECRIPSPRGFQ